MWSLQVYLTLLEATVVVVVDDDADVIVIVILIWPHFLFLIPLFSVVVNKCSSEASGEYY